MLASFIYCDCDAQQSRAKLASVPGLPELAHQSALSLDIHFSLVYVAPVIIQRKSTGLCSEYCLPNGRKDYVSEVKYWITVGKSSQILKLRQYNPNVISY